MFFIFSHEINIVCTGWILALYHMFDSLLNVDEEKETNAKLVEILQ